MIIALLKNKSKEYRYYQLVGMIALLASLAYMTGSIGVLVGKRSNAYFSSFIVTIIGFIAVVEIIAAL